MKTVTICEEFDGYINGVPYKLLEFEKDFHIDYSIDFNFKILENVKHIIPFDRWVWILIREYSNCSFDGDYPIYLFHITPQQIAEVLCVSERLIQPSLLRLIRHGLIKRYEIDGKVHIYAAKHD